MKPLKNGLTAEIPPAPNGVDELTHLRQLRHELLWGEVSRYAEKGYGNSVDYDYSRTIMKEVNRRLYAITGKDMYLWLGNQIKEIP